VTYSARSLTVRFGGTVALDDVSVTMEPGSVVVVVGGDGAGKTTLLRSVVGEVRLERGTVVAPGPQ
jgi:ABC-2 type transport system ATP-binding protein